MTVTIGDVSPRSVGMLIALYERAVGLYASLVNINAYNQPGVEAGKKAAAGVLALQGALMHALAEQGAKAATCEELAAAAGAPDEVETAFMILQRLAANPVRGLVRQDGTTVFDARYRLLGAGDA
jgi:glucose-6-phosphate isomerase